MQTFHRFYLRNGIVVAVALMIATEVVAFTLDKHGWNKSATVAMKLSELPLIISVLGSNSLLCEAARNQELALSAMRRQAYGLGRERNEMS
jgi:hypothetical protein